MTVSDLLISRSVGSSTGRPPFRPARTTRPPHPTPAQVDGPAYARAQRVEHHRDFGRNVAPDLVQDRVRVQVDVLGESAPRAEPALRWVGAPVTPDPVTARHVPPGQAQVAGPAR